MQDFDIFKITFCHVALTQSVCAECYTYKPFRCIEAILLGLCNKVWSWPGMNPDLNMKMHWFDSLLLLQRHYLLPNIDLAWLCHFIRCNRLGHAQVARHNYWNEKNNLSLQLPPSYPITDHLFFSLGPAIV